MRIHDFRSEQNGERVRMTATVTWEDSGRAPLDVYCETDGRLVPDMRCNPHAFLVAAALPAVRHGELRIRVDGEIDPELREGLVTAMTLVTHWYGGSRRVLPIEAPVLTRTPPRRSSRAGFFYSGGIDATATLRLNRLRYPDRHPGFIRDGVIVCGLEVERVEAFEYVVDTLRALAQKARIDLIPVYTNVRLLDEDWRFWSHEFASAALACVAHALRTRMTTVSISASDDIEHLEPYGSHPLLDPLYSSHDLRIRHEGIALSRLEKTRLIADWAPALASLRVCNESDSYQADGLNCGRCEKCIRTLLALIGLGASDRATTFRQRDLSGDDIRNGVYLKSNSVYEYLELMPLLRQRGRHDLVETIQTVVDQYRGEVGLRGTVRRFDRVHLNGSIATFWQSAVRRQASA